MTFEGKAINSLGQIDLEVFNEGSEVIQNPTFVIALPKTSEILEVLLTPQDGGPTRTFEKNNATISIQYFNPVREHSHVLSVSILVDGETAPIKVIGAGEGWSIRHVQLPSKEQVKYRLNIFIGCMITGIISSLYYLYYITERLNISPFEFSYRSTVAVLPVLLLIFPTYFLIRWMSNSIGLASPRNILEHDDENT